MTDALMNQGIRTLTQNTSVNNYSPVWSPDGTQIAFIRDFGSAHSLMVIDVATGETRQITDSLDVNFIGGWR